MKIKPVLFIFITIIAFVFNCSKSDETFTIETKDGVNYVHNHAPLWGDTLKVELKFLQKIGELDTEDENYLLYNPRDIVRDAEENIYVLDAGNYRIQKFNKEGKYLATIGRKGQGPGEFMTPVRMDMDSKGNLYVGDMNQISLLVLTNEGKEIKRIKTFLHMDTFRMTYSDNIITPTPSKNNVKDTQLICLNDNDGNLIKKFGEVKDYDNRDLTRYGNHFEMSVDTDDNIYVAFQEQNRIEKYSPKGDLVFRADRPLNFKLGFDKEKTIILSDRIMPRFYLVSVGIVIDHKNRIWIQTYKKQKETDEKPVDYLEFEIFDNDGILLGKIPIPKNFNYMKIFQDRLYLLDSSEEMCVYEYKIVEK